MQNTRCYILIYLGLISWDILEGSNPKWMSSSSPSPLSSSPSSSPCGASWVHVSQPSLSPQLPLLEIFSLIFYLFFGIIEFGELDHCFYRSCEMDKFTLQRIRGEKRKRKEKFEWVARKLNADDDVDQMCCWPNVLFFVPWRPSSVLQTRIDQEISWEMLTLVLIGVVWLLISTTLLEKITPSDKNYRFKYIKFRSRRIWIRIRIQKEFSENNTVMDANTVSVLIYEYRYKYSHI